MGSIIKLVNYYLILQAKVELYENLILLACIVTTILTCVWVLICLHIFIQ
ncbi:hypothetical protein F990_01164 [Acinetobacter tjernbergiae DSM 14971 = CIP 107465]|uniref:Uncharacterized protein n=1 Tax=Acinetobacter tjernbergiae DSM 14971 = CIP 107465 TaxID=1120928 RepID=V2UNU2_9GAMM|nr:hypothetical protein F990_01164 [Acinetobacter tjernbergiae DSM 14971 = CIP 107465]